MNDKVKLHLRVLGFESLLAMFLAVLSAFATKSDLWSTFALIFAGLIGVAAYESFVAVIKRVEKLERRLISHAEHDS